MDARTPQSSSGLHPADVLKRFLEAQKKNSPLLFWSFLVGTLAGGIGILFQMLVDAMGQGRELLIGWAQPVVAWPWLMPTVVSAVLAYVAVLLVRTFAPEAGGSGVQEIEGALDEVRPVRWQRVLPVKFIAGLCALSGGLVLGREGPTVQMGGNIGKMVGDWFHVSQDNVNTLIAAGAGAGLSAAFNAPLAGVLFVIEEMRLQFKYHFLSVQSLLIATSVAAIVAEIVLGKNPVIHIATFPAPPLPALWLFLVLGAIFGLFGFVFNQLLVGTLNVFAGMRGWPYTLAGLYVGAFIGFVGWLFPEAIGGGYTVIPQALQSSLPIVTLLFLFVLRYSTTMVSYGSGAPGGIFAPMLALGTLFGVWFGHFAHAWFPDLVADPGVFAVAGMCALFSATVHAPLTGITLTIEMTGNYAQILPLILTCMAATLVAQGLGGGPIYTILLQRALGLTRGDTTTAAVPRRRAAEE